MEESERWNDISKKHIQRLKMQYKKNRKFNTNYSRWIKSSKVQIAIPWITP